MKFLIDDFFTLQIWSHLLKKSLMEESLIYYAVLYTAIKQLETFYRTNNRNSRPVVFCNKAILKKLPISKRKYLWLCLFYPMNFAKFFKKFFYSRTTGSEIIGNKLEKLGNKSREVFC